MTISKTKKTAFCQLRLVGNQILTAKFTDKNEALAKELQDQALFIASEINKSFKLSDKEKSNMRKSLICNMFIDRELVLEVTE